MDKQALLKALLFVTHDTVIIVSRDGAAQKIAPLGKQKSTLPDHVFASVTGGVFYDPKSDADKPSLLSEKNSPVGLALQGERIENAEFWYPSATNPKEKEWIKLNAVPLRDEHSNIFAVLLNLQNITQSKQAQKTLKAARRFEAAGNLAGGIAHDFNNVLGVIGMRCELAADGLDETQEDLKKAFEAITKAQKRGAELTKKLLVYGRRKEEKPITIDFTSYVQGIEKLMRQVARDGIEVSVNYGANIGSISATESFLDNLFIAISTFAKDGLVEGGNLTLDLNIEELSESFAKDLSLKPGSYLKVTARSVGNNIKMDLDDLEHDTNEYALGVNLYRLRAGLKEFNSGMRKGEVSNKEFWFEFYFPKVEDANAAEKALEAELQALMGGGSADAGPPLLGRKILLVEDDSQFRASVGSILKNKGAEVFNAQNGADALSMLEGQAKDVNLILADVVMPELGGIELVMLLKQMGNTVKPILMTGYGDDPGLLDKAKELGFVLLEKPFDSAELVALIQKTA